MWTRPRRARRVSFTLAATFEAVLRSWHGTAAYVLCVQVAYMRVHSYRFRRVAPSSSASGVNPPFEVGTDHRVLSSFVQLLGYQHIAFAPLLASCLALLKYSSHRTRLNAVLTSSSRLGTISRASLEVRYTALRALSYFSAPTFRESPGSRNPLMASLSPHELHRALPRRSLSWLPSCAF